MENKRILHFNLYSNFRGGQKQTLLLHKGLLEKGYESYLLVPSGSALHKSAIDENIKSVVTVRAVSWGPPWFRRLSIIRQVMRCVEQIKPHVLHFHEPDSAYYGALFKHYLTVHTRRIMTPIKKSSLRLKYGKIDVHVGVSQSIADYLHHEGLSPVHAIHSSVDFERFRHIKQISYNQPGAKNFLYVGAFVHMKGIDVLLKAFANLLKDHQEVVLHMIGDGDKIKAYQRLAEKLGVNDFIRYYGRVSHPEAYYLSADAVVVPSRSGEGSNGVIKEAMAAGKLVISSDFAPNLELVQNNKNGMVFRNENVDALTSLMRRVANDEIKLCEQSIRKTAEKFSVSRMVDSYEKVYEKTLSGDAI